MPSALFVLCIGQTMHGRWFNEQQIEAEIFDGNRSDPHIDKYCTDADFKSSDPGLGLVHLMPQAEDNALA